MPVQAEASAIANVHVLPEVARRSFREDHLGRYLDPGCVKNAPCAAAWCPVGGRATGGQSD